MDNEFLASIEQEGRIDQPGLDKEEKETPQESPAENKPEDKPASPAAEPKEGEPKDLEKGEPKVFEAFHKHPRWLASQQELKELRAFRERVEPLLARLGTDTPEKSEKKTEIPAWFLDLAGENVEAWGKYRAYMEERDQTYERNIMAKVEEQSRKASEEVEKWDKWIQDELSTLVEEEEIQSRAKVIGFDLSNEDQRKTFRNELFKVTLDYQPSDAENNISLSKAFDILELQKLRKMPEKASADKKKEIADKTMQPGKAEAEKKDYKTAFDLQGKSFRDLIPSE